MRSVFLVGFMATGKTTVGRLVAERLGLPFTDLDERITGKAKRTVAAIFADEGEAGFRQRERSALAEVLSEPAQVVATGGGCAADPDSLARMREHGLVVALGATLDVARARAGEVASRPLFGRADDEVAALYRRRAPIYRRAHAGVATDAHSPAAVAAAVVDVVRRAELVADDELADSAAVALGERSYPVVVRAGVMARVGELVRGVLPRATRLALVTDDNVGPLHAAAAEQALVAAGFTVGVHTIAAGEASKSLAGYGALSEELIAAGLDRHGAVVALGGGVVGDLAGFVAATLFRGVPVVHLASSLLAMIDSAIGGKTGINTAAGKNLVGAFWQPALVVCDPALLATLDQRERRAAFGELVKYALLDGDELLAEVAALAPAWTAATPPTELAAISRVIGRAASIKAGIVGRDERERSGERALLNLGHTVGHAIEAAAGYGQVHHGEAVALGLVAACRVSAALGLAAAELETQVHGVLARAGLDSNLDPWLEDDVLARLAVDKKRSGQNLAFVTVASPGSCAVVPVERSRLDEILRRSRAV